jgi:hypothetical protein
MTTPTPLTSHTEQLERDALVAGEVTAGALRGIEVASVVLIGLLICPPLAILATVVVLPLLVIATAVGLLLIVLSLPYLLVHHLRGGDGGHLKLLAHRLRHAGRALLDLLPHRIVAGARK